MTKMPTSLMTHGSSSTRTEKEISSAEDGEESGGNTMQRHDLLDVPPLEEDEEQEVECTDEELVDLFALAEQRGKKIS